MFTSLENSSNFLRKCSIFHENVRTYHIFSQNVNWLVFHENVHKAYNSLGNLSIFQENVHNAIALWTYQFFQGMFTRHIFRENVHKALWTYQFFTKMFIQKYDKLTRLYILPWEQFREQFGLTRLIALWTYHNFHENL